MTSCSPVWCRSMTMSAQIQQLRRMLHVCLPFQTAEINDKIETSRDSRSMLLVRCSLPIYVDVPGFGHTIVLFRGQDFIRLHDADEFVVRAAVRGNCQQCARGASHRTSCRRRSLPCLDPEILRYHRDPGAVDQGTGVCVVLAIHCSPMFPHTPAPSLDCTHGRGERASRTARCYTTRSWCRSPPPLRWFTCRASCRSAWCGHARTTRAT